MQHDLSLPKEKASISARSRKRRIVRRAPRLANSGPGEPAFRRQFSCGCWPLMVRIIWWALRNDR